MSLVEVRMNMAELYVSTCHFVPFYPQSQNSLTLHSSIQPLSPGLGNYAPSSSLVLESHCEADFWVRNHAMHV